MYAFDTSICVDLLRGKFPYVHDLLLNKNPRLFKVPTIVEAELRVGVAKSASPEKNRLLLEEFLFPYEMLPFTSTCAHKYGFIRATLEKQGQAIGRNDLLIAATALAYDLILITQNVNEFKRVPGLQIESWHEVDF